MRLARLGFIGTPIQKTLDSLIPGWDNSVTITLILERESLAALVVAIAIALFLSLLRLSLRWYGEKHLLNCTMRMRHRLRDAYQAFLNTNQEKSLDACGDQYYVALGLDQKS